MCHIATNVEGYEPIIPPTRGAEYLMKTTLQTNEIAPRRHYASHTANMPNTDGLIPASRRPTTREWSPLNTKVTKYHYWLSATEIPARQHAAIEAAAVRQLTYAEATTGHFADDENMTAARQEAVRRQRSNEYAANSCRRAAKSRRHASHQWPHATPRRIIPNAAAG